uniref:Homeobox domain-containing protein n=1 Tax=Elaeophora elaphi TaxID=1147741 RepID=A0A0R3S759_9BILA
MIHVNGKMSNKLTVLHKRQHPKNRAWCSPIFKDVHCSYVRIRFLLRFSEAINCQLSVAKKEKSSQDQSSGYITSRKVLTISQQLQLDPTTVANFFMNARRRGHDRNRQQEVVLNSNTNSETILGPMPPPPVFEQL